MTTDTTSKVAASKRHTSHERRVSAVIVIKLIPVLKTLKQQIIFGHDTTGIRLQNTQQPDTLMNWSRGYRVRCTGYGVWGVGGRGWGEVREKLPDRSGNGEDQLM